MTKWNKVYLRAMKSIEKDPFIFTVCDFSQVIWQSIYSANLIESFNTIKEVEQAKRAFYKRTVY
jgi:transposase-like protein